MTDRNFESLLEFMQRYGTINKGFNYSASQVKRKVKKKTMVKAVSSARQGNPIVSVLDQLEECSRIKRKPAKRYVCGIDSIDSIFTSMGTSGFKSGIYLLVGDPGSGKSSMALQLQHALRQQGHLAAYFAYEGKDNVYEVIRRIGLDSKENAPFLPAIMDQDDNVHPTSESICDFMGRVHKANDTGLPAVFCVDSVKNLNASEGSTKGKRVAIQALVDTVARTNSIVFLVAHVSKETRGKNKKNKKIQGPAELEELCDVRIDFIDETSKEEKNLGYRRIMLDTSSKNRHGRPGEFSGYVLTEGGFEFPDTIDGKIIDNPNNESNEEITEDSDIVEVL